jgi:hypothetical protein
VAFPTCTPLLPHEFLYRLIEVVFPDKPFLEVKVKFIPRLNSLSRCIAPPFLTLALDGGEWLAS